MQIEINSFFNSGLAIELVTDQVCSIPGWEPVPLMRFFNRLRENDNQVLIAASIGALQWTLKSRKELDDFMSRAIPTFCNQTTPTLSPPTSYGTIIDTTVHI